MTLKIINKIKYLLISNSILRNIIVFNYYKYYKKNTNFYNHSDLHKIGFISGTDKYDKWHSFKNISYLDIYHQYFKNYKRNKINILELGVKNGSSLKTWQNYFKQATVVGLDMNANCKKFENKNTHIYIGRQEDNKLSNKIINRYNYFDIIIDDASHINELTIKSFKLYFPHLNKSGIYILEDMTTTYEDLNKVIGKWDGELIKNKESWIAA
ncbi:MAG TPA: hypothetical protein ENH82_14515 [bacterium]|nr:hypothetical protein [bacterium]